MARTPAGPAGGGGRDRFVDLVRAAGILAVVAGHWLVADLDWEDGTLVRGRSVLGEWPSLWPLTWLLQVMGLFFFVGGFANRRSWEGGRRRGEGYAAFVDRRAHRLVVPAGVFLAVLAVVGGLADALGEPGVVIGAMLTQPLWFLAVYLVVLALTPATLALHRRWGWWVLVVVAGLVTAADVARVAGGHEVVGYANALLVWGAAHQLGYLWSEGRITRRVASALAAGGLLATVLLTALGPYPARMVGVRGDGLVNSHPPTLALAALATTQIGVAVLLARPLAGPLARERWWRPVALTNLVIMTVYVWHEAALAGAARLAYPLGFPHPDAGTGGWFGARALLVLLAAAVLAGIVAAVGRVELRLRRPPPAAPGPATALVAIGAVVLLAGGFLGLAATRVLDPFDPVRIGSWTSLPAGVGLVLVGAGTGLLQVVRRGRSFPPGP